MAPPGMARAGGTVGRRPRSRTERAFPAPPEATPVSETPPTGLVQAAARVGLDLRRDAAVGFGIGAVVAAAVFVFFALLPGTTRPIELYVGLAFVLGVSVGLLVTVVLLGWQAYRATRGR